MAAPQGYLRLGQVLRHDKQPALALAVYQQGASIVEQKSPQHAGLEVYTPPMFVALLSSSLTRPPTGPAGAS